MSIRDAVHESMTQEDPEPPKESEVSEAMAKRILGRHRDHFDMNVKRRRYIKDVEGAVSD